jgi:hypothetical protein
MLDAHLCTPSGVLSEFPRCPELAAGLIARIARASAGSKGKASDIDRILKAQGRASIIVWNMRHVNEGGRPLVSDLGAGVPYPALQAFG